MANNQEFPQSIYPDSGDVTSIVGDSTLTVTGIQKAPVINQYPLNGQILIFDGPTNRYIPGDPIVSGTDPVGTTPSRPPVQIGGIDDSNLVREVNTDSSGGLQLSFEIRDTLRQILNQLKAITRVTVDQNPTNQDLDYVADQFDGVDPMV